MNTIKLVSRPLYVYEFCPSASTWERRLILYAEGAAELSGNTAVQEVSGSHACHPYFRAEQHILNVAVFIYNLSTEECSIHGISRKHTFTYKILSQPMTIMQSVAQAG